MAKNRKRKRGLTRNKDRQGSYPADLTHLRADLEAASPKDRKAKKAGKKRNPVCLVHCCQEKGDQVTSPDVFLSLVSLQKVFSPSL